MANTKILMCFLGFFSMGWYSLWISYVLNKSPKYCTGKSLGIIMTTNKIIVSIVPPFMGLLYDITGKFLFIWYFVIFIQAFGLFLNLFIKEEK